MRAYTLSVTAKFHYNGQERRLQENRNPRASHTTVNTLISKSLTTQKYSLSSFTSNKFRAITENEDEMFTFEKSNRRAVEKAVRGRLPQMRVTVRNEKEEMKGG